MTSQTPRPAAPPMRTPLHAWVRPSLLVALAAAASYINTLWASFVYDDLWTIVGNPFIKQGANVWRLVTGDIPRDLVDGQLYVDLLWRPFMVLTTFVDYHLWGNRPAGWHLQNLSWHVGATLLVLALARRLRMTEPAALAAALLFAVHPVHTEAVASINYREDLLATSAVLGAFVLVLEGRARAQQQAGERRWSHRAWWLGAFVVLVLGTNAKDTTLTFVPLLFLHDQLFAAGRSRLHTIRTHLLEYVFLGVACLVSRHWIGALLGHDTLGYREQPQALPPLDLLFTQAKIWLGYLTQHVVPIGFNADYVTPVSPDLLAWDVLGGLAAVASLVVVAAWSQRTRPVVTFGIAWLLFTLLPTSGIVPVPNLRADRYLYLASTGFCLVAGWAFGAAYDALRARARESAARALIVAFGVVCVVFAGLTLDRNRVWHDELTLWSTTAAASPGSTRAQDALMSAYARRGRHREAIAVGERMIQSGRGAYQTHMNLGISYSQLGRHEDALRELRLARAMRGTPDASLENNLGYALHLAGKTNEGLDVLRQAERVFPSHPRIHYNLGRLLLASGDLPHALEELDTALVLAPNNAGAAVVRAEVLFAMGRVDEAEQIARRIAQGSKATRREAEALLSRIAAARRAR